MNKHSSSIYRSPFRWGSQVCVVFCAFAVTTSPVLAQIEMSLDGTTTGTAEPDPKAKAAAEAIVAKGGAPMTSTEFGTVAGEAPAPPEIKAVPDEEIRQAAKDGADLIRILGLVPTKTAVAPESDFDRELFEQEEKAKELLGDEPTVIYRIKFGDQVLPDPMIVPWIAAANKLKDRFETAVNLIAANKLGEARAELLAISTEYPDSEWGVQAGTLLKKLENLREGQVPTNLSDQAKAAPEITIDGPVKPTTILLDSKNPEQSRVMIMGRSYTEGQSIRQHPDHVVKSIRATEIDVEVTRNNASKVFTVPVRKSAAQ